jgi:hypothetical protein
MKLKLKKLAAGSLILFVGCGGRNLHLAEDQTNSTPSYGSRDVGKATLGARTNMTTLVCWYVETDGRGHSGYATIDGYYSSAWPQGGGFFASIEDIKKALSHQTNRTPWLIPYYSGEIPPNWKIRGLTTNEVTRLGLLRYTVWDQ